MLMSNYVPYVLLSEYYFGIIRQKPVFREPTRLNSTDFSIERL